MEGYYFKDGYCEEKSYLCQKNTDQYRRGQDRCGFGVTRIAELTPSILDYER